MILDVWLLQTSPSNVAPCRGKAMDRGQLHQLTESRPMSIRSDMLRWEMPSFALISSQSFG